VNKLSEKILRWFLNLKYDIHHGMEGATAVEYGIMVALIAGVIITAVGLIGTALDGKFRNIANLIGS
jgi:pilus assembly protein Flp/PilA